MAGFRNGWGNCLSPRKPSSDSAHGEAPTKVAVQPRGRHAMSTLRRFALVFGIVFLAAGVAGFVPGLTHSHDLPGVRVTAAAGLLMGLFPVNVLHNLVHVLFGVWGLASSRADG